jgi:arginine decarboxylase
VVGVAEAGWTGFEAERYLRGQHGIQVEMSDYFNLVLLFHGAHRSSDLERLQTALGSMLQQTPPHSPEKLLRRRQQSPPGQAETGKLDLRAIFQAPQQALPWQQAAGKVGAELVCPYPPGIPALIPGEVVEAEMLLHLRSELQAGVQIQGAFDPQLQTLRVVD